MSVFKKYAELYDLLNKDKDYEGEAGQIFETLQKYGIINGASVLDLGCGTGKHDHILAKMGYKMTGVDLSEEMIDIANKHNSPGFQLPSLSKREGLGESCFLQSDIRNLNLNKKFDAVISMFHVMSYQNTNEDFELVLKTAYDHLEKGGIFLFDCWYGPAVLGDKPEKRTRIVENEKFKITRKAVPELKEKENIVAVCANIDVASNVGEGHVIFEFSKTRNFEKGFTT